MSKPARPVGVQGAKCPDRERIPHHRPDHPIAAILFVAQPVTMLDTSAPPGELTGPRTDVIFDADVVAENVPAPAVVIARYPKNLEAAVAQLG